MRIHEAQDGLDALEICRRMPVELVIAEMKMNSVNDILQSNAVRHGGLGPYALRRVKCGYMRRRMGWMPWKSAAGCR